LLLPPLALKSNNVSLLPHVHSVMTSNARRKSLEKRAQSPLETS
jgi:hypothetical protein